MQRTHSQALHTLVHAQLFAALTRMLFVDAETVLGGRDLVKGGTVSSMEFMWV